MQFLAKSPSGRKILVQHGKLQKWWELDKLCKPMTDQELEQLDFLLLRQQFAGSEIADASVKATGTLEVTAEIKAAEAAPAEVKA